MLDGCTLHVLLSVWSLTSANWASCRNAYNMVINKFGDQLYNGLEDTIVKHLQLIEKKVEAAQGESFLRELKLRWDHHNKSMQMIRDILMVRSEIMLAHSAVSVLCCC